MPLAVAIMYQWRWQVSLAAAAYAAWCAAEQKKAVQAVNAMPCKYRWAAGRTGTDYEYLQVIWELEKLNFRSR